ncbi:MAG TPA: TIGR02281 family clan AA aspartic protease [Sphingomicrobium sp.]|nr:TIGR02281 family clan AA aspartic protease [Sphingomicrobium sp.]
MTNSLQLGGLYLLMAMMLVLGTLMSRRERLATLLSTALMWTTIFAAGFVLFTFRDDYDWVAQRLRAEATGEPVRRGAEIRIPMALDGHFWVDGELNGRKIRFLVDSGATMTTVGREFANRAGVVITAPGNQVVRTGNGMIRVSTAQAETLKVGSIERDNIPLHVADDDLNVLGMNFLSSLRRWGVEGRWLVLVP